jgi:hypothetical protein
MRRRSSLRSRARSRSTTTARGEEPGFVAFIHENVNALSQSKLFVGMIIICLNVVSKFVNVQLSPATESFLKRSFAWQILIFCMSFMATRDIYVSVLITILFVIVSQYICNENSAFCLLPEDFKEKYSNMATTGDTTNSSPTNSTNKPSNQDVLNAIETIKKAVETKQVGMPVDASGGGGGANANKNFLSSSTTTAAFA